MHTELFRTVSAFQVTVGILREPLRMPVKGYLPSDQQSYRQKQKAPRIDPSYKEQWRKHHGIIPVIDPAGSAAFILHKKRLERTEKEYADQITNRIRAAEQEHYAFIKYPQHIKCTKDTIEHGPYKRDQHGRIIIRDLYICISCFYIVFSELLLTSGTFISGWEEPEDHFHSEHNPDKDIDHRLYLYPVIRGLL